MPTLTLTAGQYRRLVKLIVRLEAFAGPDFRLQTLHEAGLTQFDFRLDFDSPIGVFSHQLVTVLQQWQVWSLEPVLLKLAFALKAKVAGNAEDLAFLDELLTGSPVPPAQEE